MGGAADEAGAEAVPGLLGGVTGGMLVWKEAGGVQTGEAHKEKAEKTAGPTGDRRR